MHTVPAWAVMWTIAAAVYAGCKWLTWHAASPAGTRGRQAAYLLAWPGLVATSFLDARPRREAVPVVEWIAGTVALAAGAFLLFGVARLATANLYAVGWIGMVGLVLMLHFGSFHLLSCAWRAATSRTAFSFNRLPRDSARAQAFWRGFSSAASSTT